MELKLCEKFEKDLVVIYRGRYWGLNFDKKEVQEIDFEEANGCDFFDWDNGIMMASDNLKQRYKKARGKDENGFMGRIVAIAWKGHPLLGDKHDALNVEGEVKGK